MDPWAVRLAKEGLERGTVLLSSPLRCRQMCSLVSKPTIPDVEVLVCTKNHKATASSPSWINLGSRQSRLNGL